MAGWTAAGFCQRIIGSCRASRSTTMILRVSSTSWAAVAIWTINVWNRALANGDGERPGSREHLSFP